jgi:hypothetical protein
VRSGGGFAGPHAALAPGHCRGTSGTLRVHGLATLTDAEARQLAGHRALFRVVVDGEPDGDPQGGWRYDCLGEGG